MRATSRSKPIVVAGPRMNDERIRVCVCVCRVVRDVVCRVGGEWVLVMLAAMKVMVYEGSDAK